MKKRIIIFAMVVAIAVSAFMLNGCSNSSNNDDPYETVSPEPTPTGNDENTGETIPPSSENLLENIDLGELPSVTEPEVGGEGYLIDDGNWYVNNLCEFTEDRLIVNSKDEHGIAFHVGQGLGDEWKASAVFRPIKRYPEDQPICTRLFINSINGREVFILTVNFINNEVEIQLQMLDRVWKTLITTDEWLGTSSTVFLFSIEREADSKKVTINVEGDKGVLLNKTTPVDIPDELLDSIAVAGFGTYSSAVEFSSMEIQGNGPENVEYSVELEEE